MSSFGENLRREREMRGVTLEEMSESTKISTRFLKAIELERFSEMPGGVFTRSFIRTYAQYLGLDEEHVLAEYKRAAQPSMDNDLSRLGPTKPLTSKSGAPTRLVPWIVIAVLLGSGYALYRYGQRPLVVPATAVPTAAAPSGSSGALTSAGAAVPPPAPAASDASSSANGSTGAPAGSPSNAAGFPPDGGRAAAAQSPSGAASANPVQAKDNQSGTLPTAGTESASTGAPAGLAASSGQSSSAPSTTQAAGPSTTPAGGAPVLGEGDLVLQVATTEDVWMAVSADGKVLMQRLLPPRSVRTFRAKDSFEVTTGNAQGTILTLNGETQKPLGREGEFRKVHLTRDDLQTHTP